MSDYNYLPASNGSGDAPLMHVTVDRAIASTTLQVDSVTNVPTNFIGTYGALLVTGFIDPATKGDFKGHVSGGNLIIDGFEPGTTDVGNTAGQVVVIKPTSGWSNRVAAFIKNATNFGTPENLWAAIMTAASAVLTGNLTVGGNSTVSGNQDVTGNNTVHGTSRLVPASVATSDGSNNITPTSQVFEVTALAHDATVLAPTFGVQDGMTGELQIKDNGTARALTWNAAWKVIGVTLPTSTTISKYMYISYRYNSADSKFHVLGIARES